MSVRVLTTCHIQYTWDSSIYIFLFNRTTLQVFVTYLTGALYVHPLWFYKHQHDNRVRSKVFVACQQWWFQWRYWFVPSVPGYLLEEGEHKADVWRSPIERNHMGLHLENEVKTPTIIFNNPVYSNVNSSHLYPRSLTVVNILQSQICTFTWCTSNMVQCCALSLNVPQTWFNDCALSLDVPQTWFNDCALSLDVPQTWFNNCALSIDVPQTWFNNCALSLDVPQTWFSNCALSLDVPQTWFNNWPHDDSLSRNMSPLQLAIN